MPSPRLETLRGSRGQAVLEHELELGQNHVPISTSGGPLLDNFPAGQVEHLAQGIVVGESAGYAKRYSEYPSFLTATTFTALC